MDTQQLQDLFDRLFAANRATVCSVVVTGAKPDLSEIDIRVTFLAGRAYCCAEPGCHFSLSALRKIATEQGHELPGNLRVSFHGVVEEGAELHLSGGPSCRYEYDEVFADEG